MKAISLHCEAKPLHLQLSHLSDPSGSRGSWGEHLPTNSFHLILNHTGGGLVMAPHTRLTLLPRTVALFNSEEREKLLVATRFDSSEGHDALVLSVGSESLTRLFRSPEDLLRRNMGLLRRWSSREEQLYQDLIAPPIASLAKRPWYQAKILELMTLHLFQEAGPQDSFFCRQVKKQTHRHVRQALELLQLRHAEPLELPFLAAEVGCAPHYLSRLVTKETGKTLSLHLRAFRIEQAALLLAQGDNNVSEVGREVGYQSLSHFSKAFAAEQGVSPMQFLKRRA